MPVDPTPSGTRTFALAGHRSTGKTSLGDALLCAAGVTRSLGRVDEGTSLLDHAPEERQRRMTLHASFAWLDWEGYLVQLVDTPGAEGLSHERSLMLSAVDGVVVVVSAPDGLRLGDRRVLEEAVRGRVPRIVVLNRMDRPSDWAAVVEEIGRACGGAKVVPIQAPLEDEGRFVGVVSFLEQEALRYAPKEGPHALGAAPTAEAAAFSVEPVPGHLADAARVGWERIVEAVALTDDELLERYLEDLELPPQDVRRGLARAVAAGRIVPVLFASASRQIGARPLLDLVCSAFPSPVERRLPAAVDGDGMDVDVDPHGAFVAQHLATRLDEEGARYHVVRVWSGRPPRKGGWTHGESGVVCKIQKLFQLRGPRAGLAKYAGPGAIVATWDHLAGRPGDTYTDGRRLVLGSPPVAPPMMAWLLVPETPRDRERLAEALHVLEAIDPALDVYTDEVTGGPILAGLGPDHLERAVELLRGRLGLSLATVLPPVGYREQPASSVAGITGVHRRLSDGLVEEFGQCVVDVEPEAPDDGVWFVDAIEDEERVPKRFLPSIDEGIRRALMHGPTAGYPVVGACFRCTGGEYDMLQSTEDHFRLAGERAARLALERAGTRLLEPWWAVEIVVPADDLGPILAEVGARRGRVTGLEVDGREATVFAECPYRDLRTFGPRLQALTGGGGRFSARPTRYEVLPAGLVKEAITQSPWRTGG